MRLRGQANQSSEHDELHTDREKDTYTTSRIRNQNKDRHSLIRNKRLTWRRKAARVEGELKTLTTQTGPPAGLCFCFTRRVKGTLSLPSPQLVRKAKPTMMMINQRAAAGGCTSTSGRICNLQGTSSLSLLCHGIDSDREARHTHISSRRLLRNAVPKRSWTGTTGPMPVRLQDFAMTYLTCTGQGCCRRTALYLSCSPDAR